MRINQFYTCFLFLFFLFGLIFYEFLNIQYIDEILILILILYTTIHVIGTPKPVNKETYYFTAIIIFYLIYSFYIKITSGKAILLDLQQQIKPYAAFYCTYYLNPIFTKRQKLFINRTINLFSILIIFIIFTGNAQLFFEGPLAALATTMLTLSLYHFFFTIKASNIAKKKSFFIMSIGLFSGKAKFIGEYIMSIYFFFFNKKKIKLLSIKVLFILSIAGALILYFIWDKFYFYINGAINPEEKLARPLLYLTGFQILQDYFPLGTGFGTFCNEAARTVYSPLYYKYNLNTVWGITPDNPKFAADCFYPNLTQFGVIGIFLFIIFWIRRYREIKNSIFFKDYIIGMVILIIIFFEAIADTSYLSNRGIPFFILLAFIVTQYKRLKKTNKQNKKQIE